MHCNIPLKKKSIPKYDNNNNELVLLMINLIDNLTVEYMCVCLFCFRTWKAIKIIGNATLYIPYERLHQNILWTACSKSKYPTLDTKAHTKIHTCALLHYQDSISIKIYKSRYMKRYICVNLAPGFVVCCSYGTKYYLIGFWCIRVLNESPKYNNRTCELKNIFIFSRSFDHVSGEICCFHQICMHCKHRWKEIP